MIHANGKDEACLWRPGSGNFVCTLPADHEPEHLMDRDLAVKWLGAKTTHVWPAPPPSVPVPGSIAPLF